MSKLYAQDFPDLVFDDTLALCGPESLEEMAEYSTSAPTGNTPGKVWKRRNFRDQSWILGSYEAVPDKPGYVHRHYRPLEIIA